MHVGENQEAQLLSHVDCVHSKVVFQFGDGDEPVQLKQESEQTLFTGEDLAPP